MTIKVGFLEQLSTGGVATPILPPYPLATNQSVVIGRDPGCQIALDTELYGSVSRRHLVLKPIARQGQLQWEVRDLDSANGTFVNGRLVIQPQIVKSGDRITLGQSGPEFVIEYESVTMKTQSLTTAFQDKITLTQLFPLFSTAKDLTNKAFLAPATFTITIVVLMFVFLGKPAVFNLLIAAYLAGIAYYYVYQICGKAKPWWVLLASGLITVCLLRTPLLDLFLWLFRELLPGSIPESTVNLPFIPTFVQMFFGAGLLEELFKAIPVFIALGIGLKLKTPWRDRVGVNEPLDGILLATASAVGFTLLETLSQYVPGIIESAIPKLGEEQGQLLGLQLLIPRILGSVAGHMAYSGYFGYFIGLSVLKPKQKFLILINGYLSASFLHALWNTAGFYSYFWLAAIGIVSYAFLAAAILKARLLSPTRSQNFATHLSSRKQGE